MPLFMSEKAGAKKRGDERVKEKGADTPIRVSSFILHAEIVLLPANCMLCRVPFYF